MTLLMNIFTIERHKRTYVLSVLFTVVSTMGGVDARGITGGMVVDTGVDENGLGLFRER